MTALKPTHPQPLNPHEPLRSSRWSRLWAFVVLGVCLGTTVVAATLIRQRNERSINHQLALVVERMRNALHIREALYESLLHGAVGLFLSSEHVTEKEWQTFASVNVVENHSKGIARLFYAALGPENPPTKPETKPLAATTAQPAQPLIVRYVATVTGDNRLAGTDLHQHVNIVEATREATRQNTTVGTVAPRRLRANSVAQPGSSEPQQSLLLLHPVRSQHTDEPRTVVGFVGVDVHLERALAAAMLEVSTPYVQVQVHSGRTLTPETLMFDSERDGGRKTGKVDSDIIPTVGMVTIAHSLWTLRCTAIEGFADIHRDQAEGVIWIAGFTLSVMLFWLVLTLGSTQQNAMRIAQTITATLAFREQTLRQLQSITSSPATNPDKRVDQLLGFGVERLGFRAGAYLQKQHGRMVLRHVYDQKRLLSRDGTAELVAPTDGLQVVDVPVQVGQNTVGLLRFVANAPDNTKGAPMPAVTTTLAPASGNPQQVQETGAPGLDPSTLAILQLMAVSLGHELERQTALADLDAQRERLAVTLRHIGEAILSVDPAGRIVLLNAVAERLLGLDAKDAVGMPIFEAVTLEDELTHRPATINIDEITRHHGNNSFTQTAVLKQRQGEHRLVAISGAPVRNVGQQADGLVLVIRDITDERRTEQELLNAQKLESVGTLAGGIAHDFNNYLTAVLGNISLARHVATREPEVARYLRAAETATQRAQELTQQLLTFARGGAPIRRRASIHKLIRENTEFALHGSQVAAVWDIEPELWSGNIDHGQISQVVHNLVLNAIQAMPDGGRLWVTARNETVLVKPGVPLAPGPYVVLRFQDSGPGIEPDVLPRIFDPYFTTKSMGTGLGLSTCYAIIRNHGGHIAATSEPGRGATFVVYLPALTEPESLPTPQKPALQIVGGGRILVMDDDVLVREVSAEMLAALGYQVKTAIDGAEAVGLYKAAMRSGNPFDAVIMDLTVPGGMGGKDAMQKLLEMDPNAVGIVSSGYSNDPVMARHRDYGFRGVVTKPFVLQALAEVLRETLMGRE